MLRRIRYFLTARRCTCRAYPKRFAGGTVQEGVLVALPDGSVRTAHILHSATAPCHECDTYGRAV